MFAKMANLLVQRRGTNSKVAVPTAGTEEVAELLKIGEF